jgi:PAS domain S-box-containing protein
MTRDLHPLLARQLSKLGLAPGQAPDAEAFDLLLQRVSRAYVESEQERYLLERSQDIASREMVTLNRDLHSSQARLASLLSLSTDWVWEQDAEGRFTYVSDELHHAIGLDATLLLGQRCGADTPLRTSPEDDALLRAHRAARESFLDVTFEVAGPSGQCHYMRISGEPVLEGARLAGYRGVGSDVTAAVEADRRVQELARRKLEAQLDFSSRLIEVSPTPLFVKDEQGRFVTVNRAWLDLMSMTNEQVIGKTSADLYGDDAETHTRHDEQLLHAEGMVRYDNRLVRPDGEVRETVVTKLRFTQADGSPAGIIGSIIDVTEFREAERATSMARDAAEAADRAKSDFIANISHELRTPLQAIIGFSELGVARAKEPRWQEMFRDIHDGGHRMLTLVNALLDVSKIGDSTGPITRHRRDLFALAREVVKELQPLVAKRDLRVVLPDASHPLMADVDSFHIQQVIRNVLANALRFAPPGTSIDIEGRDLGDAGVEVSVRDHGPGIPPDELEAIFDPFVQSSRTGDGSGGTGLGLTICRKIMAAHGGKIAASNAEGGGARMSLLLPPCLRSRNEAAA